MARTYQQRPTVPRSCQHAHRHNGYARSLADGERACG
jgi:hypothetical protein